MSKKQVNNATQNNQYQQGSGSKYHEEHASHVPDYGANLVDPNADGVSKTSENNTQ